MKGLLGRGTRQAALCVLVYLILGLTLLTINSHASLGPLKSACDDANGDGIPDFPALDSGGARYCLEIQSTAATVGSTSTVFVRAFHENGISRIELIQDFNYTGKITAQCKAESWCTYELPLSLPYAGTLSLTANVFDKLGTFATSATQNLHFTCSAQACPGDRREEQFVGWMRSKGYPECIIEHYVAWYRRPATRQYILPFLEERPPQSRLSSRQVVHFYDIIPTDAGATFTSLAEGAAPNCEKSAAASTFCQTPRPADYHFLETHLEETFGVDFEIIYHSLPISYADTFGAPNLSQEGFQRKYIYGTRRPFLAAQNFESHSIIHYAIDSYRGELIGDMTGAGAEAEIGVHPNSLAGMRVYSHEFGHTFGLPHPFVPNPFRQFQIDGIMSNTYGYNSMMEDPTDPLERYALEPKDGPYFDAAIFADTYSQAVIGSRGLPACPRVELALKPLTARTKGDYLQFSIKVTNLGHGRAVDVPLAFALNDDRFPFAEFSLASIAPRTTVTKLIDISKERLYNSRLEVEVDSEKMIAEDNPANNFRAMSFVAPGDPSPGPVTLRKKRSHRMRRP